MLFSKIWYHRCQQHHSSKTIPVPAFQLQTHQKHPFREVRAAYSFLPLPIPVAGNHQQCVQFHELQLHNRVPVPTALLSHLPLQNHQRYFPSSYFDNIQFSSIIYRKKSSATEIERTRIRSMWRNRSVLSSRFPSPRRLSTVLQ